VAGPDAPPSTAHPHIGSTLCYPRRAEWTSRVDCIHAPGLTSIQLVRRIAGHGARAHDLLILDASVGIRTGSPDLLAAALLSCRRGVPPVIFTECNWKPGSRASNVLRTAGIRWIDRVVARYCVYSTAELENFPRRWGVSRSKMVFTPFYYNLTDDELAQVLERGTGVFAGGDSLRDYDTLLEAARHLPVDLRIASAAYRPSARPPNVRVGPVTEREYVALMGSAAVVAVPLRAGAIGIAGLETILTGMAMGKLVITTDSPGVRDYLDDGRTGILVPPGDAPALRQALEWALDPESRDEVSHVAEEGRQRALTRFSPDAYVRQLIAVADEVLEERRG
jgi:glycosyltransferase involved in cell wall biosynthesis